MMRWLTALVLPFAAAMPAQAQIEIIRPEIVATYPHDTDAFTQGLFISDGQLFESTGQFGESNLRRVDLESGAVLDQRDLPDSVFGEGSTRLGDEIFVLTWMSQTGFIYNAETLELIETFTYPGEGWGLTDNGDALIMSDGSDVLRFLDPSDMSLVRELPVTLNGRPVRRVNELEWIDGEIWANVWQQPQVLRIDPESGAVTAVINMRDHVPANIGNPRDNVLNGIAHDPETGRIFMTGKRWPVLYEIALPDAAQ
ncbi:glutaminyl-peptide cyclotransferase [Maricaulis sp.]|uniref:glutaminyl-peptide cyclotransferase n=1 Tax=Maricaulis sp. TaxID=1486257 RepID=UPI0026159003|nr:glutaminyl-peptide cyclotransferase [Maricaulis sp.]